MVKQKSRVITRLRSPYRNDLLDNQAFENAMVYLLGKLNLMAEKEAKARIKINKLLEDAGWRFFDTEQGKANIILESNVKFSELGEDFEKAKGGFIDFLLVDEAQKPLVVVEAKSEKIEPLFAKEQARKYALDVIHISETALRYYR